MWLSIGMGGEGIRLCKLPQWVDDMLTDQQSSGKDQSTTDQNSMSKGKKSSWNRRSWFGTEGENASESDQSDVETTNELTTTDDVDCQ